MTPEEWNVLVKENPEWGLEDFTIKHTRMNKLEQFLQGKKTFLTVLAACGVMFLKLMGYVNEPIADNILVILGFTSAAAVRAAIKR